MKAYERVKDLRKNILHLSQKNFAEQINISRSNLGNIETNKINLTERVLMDICRTFHINRDWLMDGTEPIFAESSNFLDEQIVILYSKLTDENKKYLYGYIQRLLEEQTDACSHK